MGALEVRMRFISGILVGVIIGVMASLLVFQNLPNFGIRTETKPVTIKATEIKDVDQTVVIHTTTEIDDEALTKWVLPLIGDIPLVKRYARGNGDCVIGSDNNKFKPYFIDADGRRIEEVKQGQKNLTLVVGPPEVLLCGVSGLTFKDGPGIPVSTTPIFNGLVDEAFHRTVCEANSDAVMQKAAEGLRDRFADHFRKAGVEITRMRFGDNESQTKGPDPRFQPKRACPPPTNR